MGEGAHVLYICWQNKNRGQVPVGDKFYIWGGIEPEKLSVQLEVHVALLTTQGASNLTVYERVFI
jgi:hypothetical protein